MRNIPEDTKKYIKKYYTKEYADSKLKLFTKVLIFFKMVTYYMEFEYVSPFIWTYKFNLWNPLVYLFMIPFYILLVISYGYKEANKFIIEDVIGKRNRFTEFSYKNLKHKEELFDNYNI